MDVKTAIMERRSLRKYKQDAVSEQMVNDLLEAARLAKRKLATGVCKVRLYDPG
jgi:nitroreductase